MWSPFFVLRGKYMTAQIMQTIDDILHRGNDVEIRRKGDGYIVLEVKKTIKYSPGGSAPGKSNRS